MGTRADFYTGVRVLRWIGSIETDAHYDGDRIKPLASVRSRDKWDWFIRRISMDKDWRDKRDGWPWAWTNSYTTDYAYWFNGKKVYVLGASEDRYQWQPLALRLTLDNASFAFDVPDFAPGVGLSGMMAFK